MVASVVIKGLNSLSTRLLDGKRVDLFIYLFIFNIRAY